MTDSGIEYTVKSGQREKENWKGKSADMLTCKTESAGGEVERANHKHISTDCLICGRRQDMPLHKRGFNRDGNGVMIDSDMHASRTFPGGYSTAGRDNKPLTFSDASESVHRRYVTAVAGQDAETVPE